MAVEDKYVNADLEAGKHAPAVFTAGDKTLVAIATEEIAAADDDGSVYRLFKSVPHSWIPVRIEIYNDAITLGTDYDLGFYQTTVGGVAGAVVDKDALADGLDMSSAAAKGSPKDGLTTVAIDSVNKSIYELAGDTLDNKELNYDIALTANTVGTAAGTISAIAWFVQL